MQSPKPELAAVERRHDSPKQGYDWRQVLALGQGHRRRLIRANVLALLATLVNVPVPLLLPLMVDQVLLHKPGKAVDWMNGLYPAAWHVPVVYIGTMVLLALLMRGASLFFNVLQSRDFSIVSKDIVFRMRRRLLERLPQIAMTEYETLGAGTVSSYMVTDLDTVDRFLGASVSRFIVASLTIIGVAAVLFWVNWKLAVLILCFNPVVIYFTTRIGKRVKELKRRENAAVEVFQEALMETLDAIHQLRAANRERHYILHLVDRARGIRRRAVAFEWKSDAASRASLVLFQFGVDVFRAAAMLAVLYSGLSIGLMFAVFGYLWFMMSPVQEILNMQYSYYAADAALHRLNRLLRLEEEPRYPALENPFADHHTVSLEVRDVHFRYQDQSILQGISLKVNPGERVAVVGASGGGKSTLVQLLLGMYTPTRGSVLFGGVPVQRIGLERIREHVATVLQHPALFNDTVRNNLTLGRDVPEARLWEALETAQLKQTVEAMASGLDTLIGRRGVRLSGGQRQRMAIARMILTDPAVVILDEATSALDAETEFQLHRALEQFLRQRTTLIIAHRLSAVKQADRAYVFEDGRIIEEGHHQQLLDQKGIYAQLYGERQS